MLVPFGTHLYFHTGTTWVFPLRHSHVGPNWDPTLFSYGIQLGTRIWAIPCWSHLGPIFIFIQDTLIWTPPIGHSHVGPNWDPHLFLYGIHLGTPVWAFPCWSQLGPTSLFTWDTLGHAHLGIPMLVPHGTHIFFHVGYTWACTLRHSHVGPK